MRAKIREMREGLVSFVYIIAMIVVVVGFALSMIWNVAGVIALPDSAFAKWYGAALLICFAAYLASFRRGSRG